MMIEMVGEGGGEMDGNERDWGRERERAMEMREIVVSREI